MVKRLAGPVILGLFIIALFYRGAVTELLFDDLVIALAVILIAKNLFILGRDLFHDYHQGQGEYLLIRSSAWLMAAGVFVLMIALYTKPWLFF